MPVDSLLETLRDISTHSGSLSLFRNRRSNALNGRKLHKSSELTTFASYVKPPFPWGSALT